MQETTLEVPGIENGIGKAIFFFGANDLLPVSCEWRTFAATVESTAMHDFEESKQRELDGLIKTKAFEVNDRSSVLKEACMYGTRWVRAMIAASGKSLEKSDF